MASTHARALPRPRLTPGVVDALAGAITLLLLGAMLLLTPAFTDYEVEIEPTLTALMRGDFATVGRVIPIYGGSLALQAPFSALGWVTAGDMGMYRATAIPGAIGMLILGVIAASWMREAGRPRREQLAALLVLVTSPAIGQAWSTGHHEEVLVASLAVGGILLVEQSEDRRGRLLFGALLLGLACGGKLWPLALVPVALAATRTVGDAVRVAVVAGTTAVAMVLPNALAHFTFFKVNVSGVGGAGIFSQGNLWWFLGSPNPNWADPSATAKTFHAAGNSFRNAPSWLSSVDHPLIVLVAIVLSAAWWWRSRQAAVPLSAGERTASLLLLVASVAWWRAVADPWFQPYYLTTALAALVLAAARSGRVPVAAFIPWAVLWGLNGAESITSGWSPDVASAVTLAWVVPVGVWSTARALRSAG